jgi:hypothetical protein
VSAGTELQQQWQDALPPVGAAVHASLWTGLNGRSVRSAANRLCAAAVATAFLYALGCAACVLDGGLSCWDHLTLNGLCGIAYGASGVLGFWLVHLIQQWR